MFLAPLISAALGLTGAAATIANVVVGLALSVGASLLARAVTPKPRRSGAEQVLRPIIATDEPTRRIFGTRATGGHLVHVNSYGTNNEWVQKVFLVGIGPHDSLVGVQVGGDRRSLIPYDGAATNRPYVAGALNAMVGGPSNSTGAEGGLSGGATPDQPWIYPDRGGGPIMTVRFWRGYRDQPADAELVARQRPTKDGQPRWTADHRLRGFAYVVVTYRPHEKANLYAETEFVFEVKGARLYDWRKDSTKPGGSGAHREADETTWEWTDNALVAAYNYQRGLTWPDDQGRPVLVHGMGLTDADLDLDAYTAEAAICDQLVATRDGRSVKRYAANLVAWSKIGERTHGDNLAEIIEATGGDIYERAGVFTPIVGAARVPVASLTDDSWVPAGFTYSAIRPYSDRRSGVAATFVDPKKSWRMAPAGPPRRSSGDAVTDGEERIAALALEAVTETNQSQRLAEIARRQFRKTKRITGVLPVWFIFLQRGDWVLVSSARRSFSLVPFKVLDVKYQASTAIQVVFEETGSDIYSFNPAVDELIDTDRVDFAAEVVTPLYPSITGSSSVTIAGAQGQKTPGFRIVVDPINDPTVDRVVVRYRVKVAGEPNEWSYRYFERADVNVTGAVIVDGLQASTTYEVQVGWVTRPDRVQTFGSMFEITTGADAVVLRAVEALSVAEGSIYWQQQAEALRMAFKETREAYATLQAQVDETADRVAQIANSQIAIGTRQERRLAYQAGDLLAAITRVDQVGEDAAGALQAVAITTTEVEDARNGAATLLARTQAMDLARANGDSALAARLSVAETALGGSEAMARFLLSTTATGASASAIIDFFVKANTSATARAAGLQLWATATDSGVYIRADKTAILTASGTPIAVFDGTTGKVLANAILANSLSALSGTIGFIQTAPSGARVEISDRGVRVFDSAGVLRSLDGDLTWTSPGP